MANDNRFVVKNGLQTQNIRFLSPDGDELVLTLSSSDVLSLTGDNGTLISLTDTASGTVFEVTSIEADADGTLRFATSAGNVLIGTAVDDGVHKLQVNGLIADATGNSSEWNTAYGWGNHATQGYATETYVNTEISNLIDSAPGTLDTLNELAQALGDDPNFATSVNTALGNRLRVDTAAQGLTSTEQSNALTNLGILSSISNWDDAYSWGDHSTEGYLTGNQTITLSGDVSGSGTTAISVTVADNSHNHVASNISDFAESVQDVVGGMLTGNTESGISVTYQDGDGTVDFDVNDFDITLIGAVVGSGTVTSLGNVSITTTAASDPTLTIDGDASGSATFTNLGNATLTLSIADDSHNHIIGNVDGLQLALDAKADDTTTITAGSGLTGGGSLAANRTISHADTSTQASVDNSGNTFIQDITLDDFGHITAISSGTASFNDTNTTYTLDGSSNGVNDLNLELIAGGSGSGTDSIQIVGGGATTVSWDDVLQKITIISTDTNTDTTYSAGSGISLAGTVFSHADTSSQASVDNSAGTVIQDIGLDTYGHVTSIGSANLDSRYYTETEIGNFFGGTTAITGYNKSNWDTAYGWGDHASAGYLLSSSYTAADVLAKLLTVDGTGTNLDADLLDGQEGSYYLDWTNTTNKPDPTITLGGDATGSLTLTDLAGGTLTVTVVDDSHTHDGRYYTETEADNRFVNVTGDTITGDLTVTGTTTIDSFADFVSPDGLNTISVNMLDGGTLSFSGTSGQLFSITDDLTGTIFSVNDISGIPSIEVDDDGTIRLAEFSGNVLIGTATDDGTNTLQVNGSISATGGTSTEWNTAYGWGDHSTEGYLTSVAFSDIEAASVLLSSEAFSDVDTQLMSAAAINDLIESKGYITSQTDSQTLSWNGTTGELSISSGNTVDLDGRYLQSFTETDPVFSASEAASITSTDTANWNTAYGWGDHAAAGYLTSFTETDPTVPAHVKSITTTEKANWNTAYGWGDHASAGYLTSFTETDPTVPAHVKSITTTEKANWNTAYSWGDHASAGYLTSFTETDPVFTASAAAGIVAQDITNWNTSYGWGDHSTEGYLTSVSYGNFDDGLVIISEVAFSDVDTKLMSAAAINDLIEDKGYLTSFTETDPVFSASAASGITSTNISNWNTAYGWGDHASEGYATETYVNNAVSNLVDSAPGTLDTLNELAAALGDDPNFSTTISTALGNRLRVDTAAQGLSGTQQTNALTNLGINDDIPNWNAAYNDKINSASFSTSTGILTLTQQDAGTVTVDLDGRYLTSFTETDPVFSASEAASITSTDTGNWDTAYGWGDHASEGYLKSVAFSNLQAGAVLTSAESFSNVDTQLMTAAAIDDLILSKGYTTNTGDIEGVTAGTGLTGGGSSGTVTISHADTSTQTSVDNSGGTVIQDITLDTYGHLTAIGSTNLDSRYYTESEIGNFFDGTTVITGYNKSNWDTAYSWGNHASAGYLTSESDPVFSASEAASITSTDTANWNTAYGWGNHASAGYLTSETDTLDSVTDRNATTSNTLTVGGLHVDSTGAVEMPSGTEAQRPTGIAGMLRFNNEAASFEGFDGTEWGAIGGGAGLQLVYVNSNYTTESGTSVYADTSSASFTLTLPASPSTGDFVVVNDFANSFSTNPLTIDRNGSTIEGSTENISLSISNSEYSIVYFNGDWQVFADQRLRGVTSERYLTGPTTGNEGTTISLVIQNWQVGDSYTISVTGGEYFQDNDLVTWTLPTVSTNTLHTMTLTLNGGGTYKHDVYVVNIPVSPDTSISITDFSINESSTGWTIS